MSLCCRACPSRRNCCRNCWRHPTRYHCRPAPKHLIRWGIAGSVALIYLDQGRCCCGCRPRREFQVPRPSGFPIFTTDRADRHGDAAAASAIASTVVRATTASAAGYDGAMVGDPEAAPAGDPARGWRRFHWHRLGHSKTERPDPETLRLNQQQLPDKPDEVGP